MSLWGSIILIRRFLRSFLIFRVLLESLVWLSWLSWLVWCGLVCLDWVEGMDGWMDGWVYLLIVEYIQYTI